MAYREASYVERCVPCGAETALRCRRCQTPACDAHLFTDDQLCEDCETEYLHQAGASILDGKWILPLPLGYVVGSCMLFAGTLWGAAVVLAGVLGTALPPLLQRERRRREAFIRNLGSQPNRHLPPGSAPSRTMLPSGE